MPASDVTGAEAVELVQQLVRNRCVNDGSGSASEEANADDLRTVLDGCGADIQHFDAAPGRRSLVAHLPGTDPSAPRLMLMAHTDVVPTQDERWSHDPYAAEIHDGFLFGRGTLDMLTHAATMALAFRDHARSGRHRGGDLVFLAVADEEALSTYGCGWLEAHHPDVLDADWVLTESGGMISRPTGRFGESLPPTLSVLAGDKGALRMELTVHGDPGHGSMPYGRQSVIQAVADVVTRIESAERELIITPAWEAVVRRAFPEPIQAALLDAEGIDDLLPSMSLVLARTVHALTRMTTTVTSITTNGSWNTAASQAVLTLDVRVLPGQTREDAVAFLHRALDGISARVEIEVLAEAASSASVPEGPLWELMTTAAQQHVPGVHLRPGMAPGVTDARFFRRRGATAFGFGLFSERMDPSWIPSMLHGDDERIDLESIYAMRGLWDSVLDLHTRA